MIGIKKQYRKRNTFIKVNKRGGQASWKKTQDILERGKGSGEYNLREMARKLKRTEDPVWGRLPEMEYNGKF